MTDCNYRFSNRIMTLVLLCLRKSSTTLYRWSGSVLNYEVVVVLTATAGGQSGPIVFPCVLINIRVKKTTNSGDPDGCVLHELLPSNLFILAGESTHSIWYYNVLNERPGWSGLLENLPSWLYELSKPKTNTIKCNKKLLTFNGYKLT